MSSSIDNYIDQKWAYLGSNQGPTDYESVALTNWAIGPHLNWGANVFFMSDVTKLHESPDHLILSMFAQQRKDDLMNIFV